MRRRVLTVGILLLAAGCGVVLGLDPPTYDGPLSVPDATVETSVPVEAAAPILPGKLDDPSRWSTYKGPGGGYIVGPFDGRFVYFVRQTDVDGVDAGLTGSRILRYDTRAASFEDPAAWVSFDPEVALPTKGPHVAAVMVGKYLVVGAFADHIFLRYDTTLRETDFGFSSSWQIYDAKALGASALAYNAALPVPDGGAVFNNGTSLTPLIHRGGDVFDAGWESATFDGGTFACGATFGGACTKNAAFFVPSGGDKISCLARYDVTKPLATGFDSFDLAKLGDEYGFIIGGVTTPQHLYLTQYNTRDAAAPIRILRKPVEGSLDAGWEGQPTNVKNPLTRGFLGGTYDGRWIYFAPYPAPTTTVIFARYDTTLGFNDANAWDVAAGAAVGVPANRYWGATFDGQYVYYASYAGLGNEQPTMARFKVYDTPIAVPSTCQ